MLPACGGGGGGEAEASGNATASGGGQTNTARPQITTLQITPSTTGTLPFSATVMALRGEMPAGAAIVSADNTTLSHSVFTKWEDGSAAVVIVSGVMTVADTQTKSLKIQVDTTPTDTRTALTTADIRRAVQSVSVNLGSAGSATRTEFSTPERIWWANAVAICARYRLAISGHASLEAVIDIQAFTDGRAHVEVVVENAKFPVNAPRQPVWVSYTGGYIEVNGTRIIENVSSAGAAEGSHSGFRAWYAAGWVGGTTGLRVTQSHEDLQKHPLFFKCIRSATTNMAQYANDRYTPWATGRHRAFDMGSTGDDYSIGPLPQWEAHFLQSGDARAARATEASALAVLTYNVNYRDQTSGWVPSFEDIGTRQQQGNPPSWPYTFNAQARATWEVAHHAAAGLMAFIVRPSPVFMEIAQKLTVWNGTFSGDNNEFAWSAGTFGFWYQMRGKAWALRSLVHAIFITPNDMPWRAGGVKALANNATLLNRWTQDSRAKLNSMWDYGTGFLFDAESTSGFQVKMWQFHYMITEVHKAAASRLLSGPSQDTLNRVADWCALQPVRWVTEQPEGGWRWIPYHTTLGRSDTAIDSLPTWGEQQSWARGGKPSSVSGPWMDPAGPSTPWSSASPNNTAGAYWASYFWAALTAAVERDVPNARSAWNTVNNNVTALPTWLVGFALDPRWGSTPRNL